MKVTAILGIDIAKHKFDVCLRPLAEPEGARPRATFTNNLSGFRQLRSWLAKHPFGPVQACLESTSRYGDALALFLFEEQHQVSVVNPRRTRAYANSRLVRTQNDQIDAGLIADFCASEKPRLWQPAPASHRQLQDLVRLRNFFVDQKIQCANRLESEGAHSTVFLKRQISQLERTVAAVEKQMARLLEQHAELGQTVQRLQTINGVGPITAAVVLAELPPVAQFAHVGSVVAFAGLDPKHKESGTSVATVPRFSKMGSSLLRKILYMAALAAMRSNPIIQAQTQRLAAKGKGGKLAIGAAMRKLLRLIYGVLKSQTAFDPNYQSRPRPVPASAGTSGGDGLASLQLAAPPVATA